jgi:hydrogenase nickel incorporation protein HypA/HybF
MHELSIAMSILDLVGEESQRRGNVRIAAIHLRLGELSGVVKEALVSAYDMAREGTDLAECRLLVEQIPVMIDCPHCEVRRSVVSVHQICCAVCGAVAPQIASGRELEVAALEIDS